MIAHKIQENNKQRINFKYYAIRGMHLPCYQNLVDKTKDATTNFPNKHLKKPY